MFSLAARGNATAATSPAAIARPTAMKEVSATTLPARTRSRLGSMTSTERIVPVVKSPAMLDAKMARVTSPRNVEAAPRPASQPPGLARSSRLILPIGPECVPASFARRMLTAVMAMLKPTSAVIAPRAKLRRVSLTHSDRNAAIMG